MDTVLVATTPTRDLHALGTAGQTVASTYQQLTGYLARTLGADHAGLFAEPNPDADRGVIDWYAPATGAVVPLDQLPPDRRGPLAEQLGRLVADIRAEADRLAAGAAERDRLLAALLRLALEIPGPQAVYAVGDRPVLVAWGHLDQAQTAERGLLMRYGRPPVIAAAAAAAPIAVATLPRPPPACPSPLPTLP